MGRIITVLKGLLAGLGLAQGAAAAEATLAVASNFLPAMQALEPAFEAETGHDLIVAHGSTGRLYAQILSGAPFDVFLAADAARPEALAVGGQAVETETYALGQLVLVARQPWDVPLETALNDARVALADPAVAPYGAAALEVLKGWGLDPEAMDLILGDSVGQVASIFATGNAPFAFIARAQVASLPDAPVLREAASANADKGPVGLVIEGGHAPIRQDAALLRRGAGNPAARAFFDWLKGPRAIAIIREAGYGTIP